ncbi:unnamed protein product [Moneuplotes crassus]|uniref:Uncharacterized protein n=1 Tax=Euplotes crassus TaxID=5936 RepID=A0AAD1UED8_EUPCR|nr:unnamed protein product [Moneuplotes crassus]
MHQSNNQQNTKFYLEDLEFAKNVLHNPSLKPILAEAQNPSTDCDIFFCDDISEPDIGSSECISINLDHLEKDSQCSALSSNDYQIYDDPGGSSSTEDPCIIKMRLIPNCSQSVSTKRCTNYEKASSQADPEPSIYKDILCPSEITLGDEKQCVVEEEPTKFVMPMPKKKRKDNRYDSLYRSLLRKLRKWFQSLFRSNTNYEKCKKSNKPIFFLKCVEELCKNTLNQHSNFNLVFTLANLINPRLIQKHKANFCKEYSCLRGFLKDLTQRVGPGKDVFTQFSFVKMERTVCTKEYDTLLHFFIDHDQDGFSEDEKYALQQMLKVSSCHILSASNACP